jgi:hypothetical protein
VGFGTPSPDLKDDCGRLAAILQVVAVRFTGFQAGAIAGVEHDFAGIGNEHDRATLMEPWSAVVSAVAVGLVSGLLVLSAGIIGRFVARVFPPPRADAVRVKRLKQLEVPRTLLVADKVS